MKSLLFASLLAIPAVLSAQAPAALPASAKVGAKVTGSDNQPAGKIAQITDSAVFIDTGTNKVPVPPMAITADGKNLKVTMTKAGLDAAYTQATQQARASFVAQLTPGKMVHGLNGAMLGTIKEADAQFVTVKTARGDAKLPVAGFGPGPDGATVQVGLTAEQLDAAMSGAANTPSQ